MVNVKVRTLLPWCVAMLIGCAASTEERDEQSAAHGEALPADEAPEDADLAASWAGPTRSDADWAGPTDNDKASSGCWPRIEASNWYCCGRFRECKAVYICEYCTDSKSCYRQGGIQERSSPGCY